MIKRVEMIYFLNIYSEMSKDNAFFQISKTFISVTYFFPCCSSWKYMTFNTLFLPSCGQPYGATTKNIA